MTLLYLINNQTLRDITTARGVSLFLLSSFTFRLEVRPMMLKVK